MRTCGVYAILNVQTNQIYVGCSVHIEERWEHHFHLLQDGLHQNHLLQQAYDLAPDIFAAIVLETTVPARTYEREQIWITRMLKRHELYNLDLRTHESIT